MKRFLFLLLALSAAALHADTQVEVRVKNAGAGFTSHLVTLADGQVISLSSGVPAALTPASAWGDISGTLSAQEDLQDALDALQPLDGDLTSIAALATQSYGRGVLEAGNAAALRSYAGLGPLATLSAVTTAEITAGTIVNANISASAAIAISKIDGLQTALDGKAAALHTHTPSAILLSAANRLVGSSTGAGPFYAAQDISVASPLSLSSGTLALATGDRGDITVSGTNGVTWTIDNAAVSNAKLANSSITIAGSATALGGSITASTIMDSVGSTRGSVLYRGASGWAALTPGTSGYVLKSNGSGADPSWAAVAGLAANTFTGAQTLNVGTLATAALPITQTWNSSGTTCRGLDHTITDTASAADSTVLRHIVGSTTVLSVSKSGDISSDGTAYSTWNIGSASGNRQLTLHGGGGGNISFTDAGSAQFWTPIWCRPPSAYIAVARNGKFVFGSADNDFAGTIGAEIRSGSGSPEGVVTAPVGSLYLNQAGGASTTLYVKESGTGNTGWIAK